MMKRYRGLLTLAIIALVALFGVSLSISTAPVNAQGNIYGVNWQAEFANTPNRPYTGPAVATTFYPNGLNFNWAGVPNDANNVPIAGVNADNFSVKFTSSQTFQAGTYNFTAFIDDQATITIAGITEVLNASVPGTYTFPATFQTAGTYTIQIDFVDLTSTASIQFFWQLSGGGPPVGGTPGVPFLTPTPTGPQANVVNVRGLSLRTGPYLGASFVGVLRPNIAYNVSARNDSEGGGYTWYLIDTGTQVGWSSGRYLTLNIDPLSLPVQGTVFDELGNPPDRGVIAVPRAVMNLRIRPSIRSARIGQVPWGAEVQLLGRTIQGGQHFWFLVRFNGVVGWIYAPYVGVRGNINAVPVY